MRGEPKEPEYIEIGGAIYKKATRDLDQTQTVATEENDTALLEEFIALRDSTTMSMREILREFGVNTEQLTPDMQRYVSTQIKNDEITWSLTGYPAEQSLSNPRSSRPEVRPEPEPQSDISRRARNIMFLPMEGDENK